MRRYGVDIITIIRIRYNGDIMALHRFLFLAQGDL